jgi:predicted CoA-substrate-specific enzyme activase
MYFLGVDLGSVSTDFVLIDENLSVKRELYLKTKGNPIKIIKEGFKILKNEFKDKEVASAGTTGSGRHICAAIIGADIIKNEITTHAVASLQYDRSVRTIIEIGGQDSKIILLNKGIITDFSMNTVCAAGTGSFIDRQAERLEIPIEEFGKYALLSKNPVRIAGRCAVFAESDMIHKQQLGYNQADIIRGLCDALVRNYLNNVAKGKNIEDKVLFQGGVAANPGIRAAFEKQLGLEVIVPAHYNMMGAIGAAILAKEAVAKKAFSLFRGFSLVDKEIKSRSFDCEGCSNNCEISEIKDESKILGYFGDRCSKWANTLQTADLNIKKEIV